jgi:SsrA-binding protein
MHIAAYKTSCDTTYDPRRSRKLLLNKKEIVKLIVQSRAKGYAVIPLRVYFVQGRAKVEIALGKGKRKYDKRESIRKKEHQREMEKHLKKRK